MQVADYAKFYEFLLRGGKTEDGVELLKDVRRLTHGTIEGVDFTTPLGTMFGLKKGEKEISYGWAVRPKTESSPHVNFWGGYASTYGQVYVEDDSYILVFPQYMRSSFGGNFTSSVVHEVAINTFESVWA